MVEVNIRGQSSTGVTRIRHGTEAKRWGESYRQPGHVYKEIS